MVVAALPAHAGELFRWTDENGAVHYSDHIPPQYVDEGYNVISEQGITVLTIAPASEEPLPPEEPKLSDYEQGLLANYSDASEIIATRQRLMADIDTRIALAHEVIDALERQFNALAQEAGNHERRGDAVPENVQHQIATTQRKITDQQTLINNYTESKQQTWQRFQQDLERYQALTGHTQ